jgi:hypothetical protein
MNDARFYVLSATAVFGLAVVAGAGLTRAGVPQTDVTHITISILGFAAIIVTQARSAAAAAVEADRVRTALAVSDLDRAAGTASVRADLESHAGDVQAALESTEAHAAADRAAKADDLRAAFAALPTRPPATALPGGRRAGDPPIPGSIRIASARTSPCPDRPAGP